MNKKEMEEKKEMVLSMCICPSCPSWVECDEDGGFCLVNIGKSECISEEKGCVCGKCPVTEELGLKHGFYCTRGSEEEQS
jgi:hypothetical protein